MKLNRINSSVHLIRKLGKNPKHYLCYIAFFMSLTFLTIGWVLDDNEKTIRSGSMGEEVTPILLTKIKNEMISDELPLDINSRVDLWARRFANDDKWGFEEILSRSGIYFDMITAKIGERGMPKELIYLAMIESGFFPSARSSASALGIWQLMSSTAREYGLRIDSYVDERLDPVRSTDAALDYLDFLYQRYGSWYLAAAAYNAGPTRVSRVLKRYAGGQFGEESLYWEIIDHLPIETAHYVPKFIAATHLARNSSEYGLQITDIDPYAYDVVWTPEKIRLKDVSEFLGVPEELMYELNPQLIRGVTPPGELYSLRIPVGESNRLIAALGLTNRTLYRADD